MTMADKPSRALIIYGDGLMSEVKPCHTHLHSLASLGCCGFLPLRDLPSPVSEDEKMIRELAQLMDVYDNYSKALDHDVSGNVNWDINHLPSVPNLEERFMGIKASMLTNSSTAYGFGKGMGFSVKSLDEFTSTRADEGFKSLPDPCLVAFQLLSMLGVDSKTPADKNYVDLLFLHIRPDSINKSGNNSDCSSAADALNWIDSLVGIILEKLHDGTDSSSRLYISTALSYSMIYSEKTDDCSLLVPFDNPSSIMAELRPRQSYTMKSGKQLENIRNHHPILVAQYQRAVTRCDKTQEFSFDDFQKNAGNLAILADRFIYEVAFKLWRAPKYGA